jgi:DNA-binding transcriptional MerR regulator
MELDIGEVAARSGLPPSALRFYERQGLVEPVGRNGLRRTYAPDIVDRLALIVVCKQVGFTVGEIGELLSLEDESARRHRIAAKIAELDERIAEMTFARDQLDHAAACQSPSLLACPHFTAKLHDVLPVDTRQRDRPPP